MRQFGTDQLPFFFFPPPASPRFCAVLLSDFFLFFFLRVESVLKLPIGFHCFYTQVQIPASVSNNRASSRTFVELTSIPKETQNFFSPRNCSGQDEIEAHMEMFNPDKNFDYYQMGEETVKRVSGMIENALKLEL